VACLHPRRQASCIGVETVHRTFHLVIARLAL
jgi:hypothetical protein